MKQVTRITEKEREWAMKNFPITARDKEKLAHLVRLKRTLSHTMRRKHVTARNDDGP